MSARLLSKSQYVRSLQCQKSLWLYRNRKDLAEPVTPDQKMVFDQGTEVGIMAHQRVPGGVLIADDHEHLEEAVEATRKAILKKISEKKYGDLIDTSKLSDGNVPAPKNEPAVAAPPPAGTPAKPPRRVKQGGHTYEEQPDGGMKAID